MIMSRTINILELRQKKITKALTKQRIKAGNKFFGVKPKERIT